MGSDKVKGSSARLIEIPGYHIKPQYDLVHTRHLVDMRRHKGKSFHLNLAPMVDMFSVLVIYLIMNFSATGEVFFMSKDIVIPQASKGRPMESYPLVSIVREKVLFDAEDKGGGGGLYAEDIHVGSMPELRRMLEKIKKLEEEIGGPKNFKGQINIQADEKTSMNDVKKVMRVLIEEGWTGINFIVEPLQK